MRWEGWRVRDPPAGYGAEPRLILAFAFLLLLALALPAAAGEEIFLTVAKFDLKPLLERGRFDAPFRSLLDPATARLAALAGRRLEGLAAAWVALERPSGAARGAILFGDLDLPAIGRRAAERFGGRVTTRPGGGFTLGGWGLAPFGAKRLLLAPEADLPALLAARAELLAVTRPRKPFEASFRDPGRFARLGALSRVAPLLPRARRATLALDDRKVAVTLDPAPGEGDLAGAARAFVKAEYEGIDAFNKAHGMNFWARNWTMAVRSAAVKGGRGGAAEISARLIERGEELLLRLVLPEVDRFVDEIELDADTLRRERSEDAAAARSALRALGAGGDAAGSAPGGDSP